MLNSLFRTITQRVALALLPLEHARWGQTLGRAREVAIRSGLISQSHVQFMGCYGLDQCTHGLCTGDGMDGAGCEIANDPDDDCPGCWPDGGGWCCDIVCDNGGSWAPCYCLLS